MEGRFAVGMMNKIMIGSGLKELDFVIRPYG